MRKSFTLFILLFITVELLSAQSILIRGPYLNLGTSESMVVRWRTDLSEVGVVRYGTDPNQLDFSAADAGAKRDHEVVISDLQPATVYYYTIGTATSNLTQSDGSYYFKTSPEKGSKAPIRIWALGDFGNGSQAQKDVRNSYIRNYGDVHTDIWMWLGDNAYSDGTDEEYQKKVFEVYPEELRKMVVWPTPGNHDYGDIDIFNNGPYYDIFTLPTQGEAGGEPSGMEAYYSFDYGNIHFISINSEFLLSIISNSTEFTQWLERDLAQNEQDWVVAFWHQPPYTKGTHDSDDFFSRSEMTRKHVNPILERYGCDVVLSGHSHGYERTYLIKGHFGKSDSFNPATHLLNGSNGNPDDGNTYTKKTEGAAANQGTVYLVSGSGGQKGSGNSSLDHPAMFMATETYHGSTIIDVEDKYMHVRFIDTTGAVIDQFAIQKESGSATNVISYDRLIQLNAYPNPFQSTFTVEFSLEREEKLSLEIKDIQGRVVEKLEEGIYPAGVHKLEFTPGAGMSAGVYLIEVKAADKLGAKRMLRME
jgi:acid phosphatase type 7